MIKPTYITFNQAVWLKQKGFNFNVNSTCCISKEGLTIKNQGCAERNRCLIAPEQWQVIEWLRVNHALWIYVIYEQGKWHCNIQDITHTTLNEEDCRFFNISMFNSPQEAYSAAFDWIKDNNLI